jgi:putative MATE family efflux protein
MSKTSNKQIDMLNGPLIKKIILFALPVAASSILQQLFNSADVAVVGRYAGSHALAAVGGNTSVTTLLINLFVGLSIGANVVIANYIGQQNAHRTHDVVQTVMLLSVISGVILLVVGIAIANPILKLMNTPTNVIDLAAIYLRIYFLGMPFLMVYNFGAAILRSIGDTKRPLYCLIVSGVINVLLNLLFVIVFKMSVAGVAIATVIADFVSGVLIVYFLVKEKGIIHLDLHNMRIRKEYLIKVIKIGAPAGIQGMVFSLSNVVIQTSINGFGAAAVAGSAAAVNFEFFTYFVTNAFSQACVTFTSQNFGAKKYDRCKKIFNICIVGGIVGTLCMIGSFITFKEFFLTIYTNDPKVIPYGLDRMMLVEMFAFLPVLYEVSSSALRGIGYSTTPALITIFGTCLMRIVYVYTIFQFNPTWSTLLLVYPVSWVITTVLVGGTYLYIRKKVFSNLQVETI